ncbi:MAG: VapE domain-containing protein [Cyanobacteria bacterium P01_A01_bin.84]
MTNSTFKSENRFDSNQNTTMKLESNKPQINLPEENKMPNIKENKAIVTGQQDNCNSVKDNTTYSDPLFNFKTNSNKPIKEFKPTLDKHIPNEGEINKYYSEILSQTKEENITNVGETWIPNAEYDESIANKSYVTPSIEDIYQDNQKLFSVTGQVTDDQGEYLIYPRGFLNNSDNKRYREKNPDSSVPSYMPSKEMVFTKDYISILSDLNNGKGLKTRVGSSKRIGHNFGIYYVVNGQGTRTDSIQYGTCLFFEIDKRNTSDEHGNQVTETIPLYEQYTLVFKKLGIQPTIAIRSGGKSLHFYYKFDEKIPVEKWKDLTLDLLAFLPEADQNLKDPSRVLRMIGFKHQSTGQYSTVYKDNDRSYSYQELRDIIPERLNKGSRETSASSKTVTHINQVESSDIFHQDGFFSLEQCEVELEDSDRTIEPIELLVEKALGNTQAKIFDERHEIPNGEGRTKLCALTREIVAAVQQGAISNDDAIAIGEEFIESMPSHDRSDPWTEDHFSRLYAEFSGKENDYSGEYKLKTARKQKEWDERQDLSKCYVIYQDVTYDALDFASRLEKAKERLANSHKSDELYVDEYPLGSNPYDASKDWQGLGIRDQNKLTVALYKGGTKPEDADNLTNTPIRRNLLTGQLEFFGVEQDIKDEEINFQNRHNIQPKNFEQVINKEAKDNIYNPVAEKLARLYFQLVDETAIENGNKERCRVLSDYKNRFVANYQAENPQDINASYRTIFPPLIGLLDTLEDYISAVFYLDDKWYIEAIKNMMISAVARAFDPGCKVDTVTIFLSKQGRNKSQSISLLAYEKYYVSKRGNSISNKDDLMESARGWIQEYGEIDKITASRSASETKDNFSRSTDVYRKPYARVANSFPRHWIDVGTTNEEILFLDEDNRRYNVVELTTKINTDFLVEFRDKAWALATQLYFEGEKWWYSEDEEGAKVRRERNLKYRYVDSRSEDVLDRVPMEVEYVSPGCIANILEGSDISHSTILPKKSMDEARNILRKSGWKRCQGKKYVASGKRRDRPYINPNYKTPDQSRKLRQENTKKTMLQSEVDELD